MAAPLNENAITKLATVTGVDMKTVQKNTLYTVPTGKTAYVTSVVIRETSASLAGGTDYDFGTGANADTWRQTNDLSSMTTAGTDYMEIRGAANTKYTDNAAAAVFGIKPITGSTGAATAVIDIFGFLA
ncbi:hypothetical protein LCGC14_0929730 [marine sediment metagenome]|uniref:Uncharacterized protein n=1 Tax=marine sediment metagenome TaxID=412755 RepID=A0A0F9P986_9ZZZZ